MLVQLRQNCTDSHLGRRLRRTALRAARIKKQSCGWESGKAGGGAFGAVRSPGAFCADGELGSSSFINIYPSYFTLGDVVFVPEKDRR
jgi:hypothetical protein